MDQNATPVLRNRHRFTAFIAILFALLMTSLFGLPRPSTATTTAPSVPYSTPLGFADLIERVRPTVVNIATQSHTRNPVERFGFGQPLVSIQPG